MASIIIDKDMFNFYECSGFKYEASRRLPRRQSNSFNSFLRCLAFWIKVSLLFKNLIVHICAICLVLKYKRIKINETTTKFRLNSCSKETKIKNKEDRGERLGVRCFSCIVLCFDSILLIAYLNFLLVQTLAF